jgi:putative ABC transport system ATP-binding protein
MHTVLQDLDVDILPGRSTALVGRSGSGKSTLLNVLSGIDECDAGTIEFRDTCLVSLDDRRRTLLRRRHMGFVFQFFNLLPTLSVLDNVVLPQSLNGVGRPAARRRARELLRAVGLAGREDSFADRLSGGEQQRVALVRAVAHEPSVVFADEPTGNLDERTGEETLELLRSLVKSQGVALIMATHSKDAAAQCDDVYELRDGQLCDGSPASTGLSAGGA